MACQVPTGLIPDLPALAPLASHTTVSSHATVGPARLHLVLKPDRTRSAGGSGASPSGPQKTGPAMTVGPTGCKCEPERADDAEVPAAAKPDALLPSKASQSRCIYTPTPGGQINRFV